MKLTSLSISHFESTIIADNMRVNFFFLKNLSQIASSIEKDNTVHNYGMQEVGEILLFILEICFKNLDTEHGKCASSLIYNVCQGHTGDVFKRSVIPT